MTNIDDLPGSHEWWRGCVVYQIYPRSFQDSNGDGLGDLPGISQRLDHVARLGADALWICPFFVSPMRDGGYDVVDHCDVAPCFGTLSDFDALISGAHDRGLRVLIDLVLSHTSSDHPWFKQSSASRDNPRSDWYVWADPRPDGSPPNNWVSLFGGSAWAWHEGRRQFYLHNFWDNQPDLNFHHPDVQKAVLDVAKFWLDRGVDGFRIDTANYFFHDALLRDNPPALDTRWRADGLPLGSQYALQQHIYDKSRPENLLFIERLRQLVNGYDGRTLLAEIGDDDAPARMLQYTEGDRRLHMAYSFNLLECEFRPSVIADIIERFNQSGPDGWPCWSISNHDVPRALTRWFGERPDHERRELAQLVLMLLLSLRGSVCLYQGDELGLTEASLEYGQLQDSFGIAHWPTFKGRDGCRTPMPWSGEQPAAGFTAAAASWLPVATGHHALNVQTQESDPASTLQFTRRALATRRNCPSLRLGTLRVVQHDATTLVIERCQQEHTIWIALNFSDTAQALHCPPASASERWSTLLSSNACTLADDTLHMPARSSIWIETVQETRDAALEATSP